MQKIFLGLVFCIIITGICVLYGRTNKGEIELLFYDNTGKQLSYAQMRQVSNAGNDGMDNDIILDRDNLQLIKERPIKEKNGLCVMEGVEAGQALAINWLTKPSGYGLYILDNKGKGFSGRKTLNFSYQAATDALDRLDEALKKRIDYNPSSHFKEYYLKATYEYTKANRAATESEKGVYGQKALDALAVAYDIMSQEYGLYSASKKKTPENIWIGFTLDSTENFQENLQVIRDISHPFSWVRIVMDVDTPIESYRPMVEEAHRLGIKVLMQPVDSFYEQYFKEGDSYLRRFEDCLKVYPDVDAWEAGNETNGAWVSDHLPENLYKVLRFLKEKGQTTIVTFFWQLNTSEGKYSLFNWTTKNISDEMKNNIDIVLISQYQEQAPMGIFFDELFTSMEKQFPRSKIGLGELGYWIPEQDFWWAYDEKDPEGKAMDRVLKQYYYSAYGYPNSIGGVFWWNFRQEIYENEERKQIISDMRDQFLKE